LRPVAAPRIGVSVEIERRTKPEWRAGRGAAAVVLWRCVHLCVSRADRMARYRWKDGGKL